MLPIEPAPPRYRQIRFCPRCGAEYGNAGFHERDFVFICSVCTFDFYQNPLPSSVVAIAHPQRHDSLLVLRRRTPPAAGLWCVPGGFMRYGEDPAACAAREALEETGVQIDVGPVLNVGSMYYRYRDAEVFILEVAYLGHLRGPLPPLDRGTAEAAEIRFMPVGELVASPGLLAFPSQIDVLRAFRDRAAHAA